MPSIIQKHLQSKPVKNYQLSIQTSEQKLSQMAQIVVNFIADRSAQNLKALRETKAYWEAFFSDWVADIEMKKAILKCIQEGDIKSLFPHETYILKLSEDACAKPNNTLAPLKKKKDFEDSFLDELRGSKNNPYHKLH